MEEELEGSSLERSFDPRELEFDEEPPISPGFEGEDGRAIDHSQLDSQNVEQHEHNQAEDQEPEQPSLELSTRQFRSRLQSVDLSLVAEEEETEVEEADRTDEAREYTEEFTGEGDIYPEERMENSTEERSLEDGQDQDHVRRDSRFPAPYSPTLIPFPRAN